MALNLSKMLAGDLDISIKLSIQSPLIRRFIDKQKDKIMNLSIDVMVLRDELNGDKKYKA